MNSNHLNWTPNQDVDRLSRAYTPRLHRGDIVGIDLDNTLICYDKAFSALAIREGLLPDTASFRGYSKRNVKRYLIGQDQEADWTELQGKMYGPSIHMASPFFGALSWIKQVKALGIQVYIISHKTKTPYRGPAYDLHQSAHDWLKENGFLDVMKESEIFFEITKADKLNRIAACQCDYFIDDLTDILLDDAFPAACQGILFNPRTSELDEINSDLNFIQDWHIAQHLLGERRMAA